MSLRSVLLAMLSKESNTGYGLGRLLRDSLGHLWSARLQQIYSELAKLERDGLVTVARHKLPNRPAKKVYTLTVAGDQALAEWLESPLAPPQQRDGLLVRLYCLERLPAAVAARLLHSRLEESEAQARDLGARLAQARGADAGALGLLLTLDAAQRRMQEHAAWCARALELLGEERTSEADPKTRAAGA